MKEKVPRREDTLRLRYLLAVLGALALLSSCSPPGTQTQGTPRTREGGRRVAQAAAADCGGWNTSAFFRSATLARVQGCLAAGANVNTPNQGWFDNHTPLHLAAMQSRNPDIITALVNAGANVNARAQFDNTPLHLAARDNTVPGIITALVNAGANVNARAQLNNTPLHRAAESNTNPAIIIALLAAGADATARNGLGKTPWDYAKDRAVLQGSSAYRRLGEAQGFTVADRAQPRAQPKVGNVVARGPAVARSTTPRIVAAMISAAGAVALDCADELREFFAEGLQSICAVAVSPTLDDLRGVIDSAPRLALGLVPDTIEPWTLSPNRDVVVKLIGVNGQLTVIGIFTYAVENRRVLFFSWQE